MPKGLDLAILSKLDIAVVEVMDDLSYEFIGELPSFIHCFYQGAVSGRRIHQPYNDSPFVEFFIREAIRHWKKEDGDILKSAPFIEIDDQGRESAFECSAFYLDERKILLIKKLGGEYEEIQDLYQKARNGLLYRETLEDEVRERTVDIRLREEEIALRLVSATEYRDNETGAHIRRLGLFSEMLAEKLGWDKRECDDLRIAAAMHDIGKIGIPDGILRKPGKLTPDEYEIMKRHTVIGAKVLEGSDVPLLQMARDIALGHHEKWNGQGYPFGRSGLEIPQSARIVTVADVYDALINDRVYRPALKEKEVMDIMTRGRGVSFDPDIFDSFMELYQLFCRIQKEFKGEGSMSDTKPVTNGY